MSGQWPCCPVPSSVYLFKPLSQLLPAASPRNTETSQGLASFDCRAPHPVPQPAGNMVHPKEYPSISNFQLLPPALTRTLQMHGCERFIAYSSVKAPPAHGFGMGC